MALVILVLALLITMIISLINMRKNILSPKVLLCGHLHHPISTIDKINDITIYNTGVDKTNLIPNHHIIQI